MDGQSSSFGSSLLFSRSDSTEGLLHDDSLLPTSAIPYIYNERSENDIAKSHLSTSIFPPLESFGEDSGSYSLKHKRDANESQMAAISSNTASLTLLQAPSATDTVKEAIRKTGTVCDPSLNGGYHNASNIHNSSVWDNSNVTSFPLESGSSNDHFESYTSLSAPRRRRLWNFSACVTTSQTRTDPSGKLFTSYIICIETEDGRYNVEHRYSDFSRLYRQLKVNGIECSSPFPSKSLAGRIGDWTPSIAWAPEKNKAMIRNRERMLDRWIIELSRVFQYENDSSTLHIRLQEKEIKELVYDFFQRSSTAVPPCDRANNISWDGLLEDDMELAYEGQMKHEGGAQKFVGNPLTFNLTSSIRQAAYTIMHMCGTKSTLTMNGDQSDQTIPLDLLREAKGLVFLTVAKAGVLVSIRCGTGLMVARRRDGSWTPPVALATVGVGWGALIGGDITNYLVVLNTERAVRIFAQKKSVNLGGELGVAIGIGRAATGNLNAGPGGLPAPAYAYAHSKGLFAGISVEGAIGQFLLSTIFLNVNDRFEEMTAAFERSHITFNFTHTKVGVRQDVNAKFYGKTIDAEELLFGESQPRPRAALPIYDSLNEAMSLEVPDNGFRPSEVLYKHTASKPGNKY